MSKNGQNPSRSKPFLGRLKIFDIKFKCSNAKMDALLERSKCPKYTIRKVVKKCTKIHVHFFSAPPSSPSKMTKTRFLKRQKPFFSILKAFLEEFFQNSKSAKKRILRCVERYQAQGHTFKHKKVIHVQSWDTPTFDLDNFGCVFNPLPLNRF